MKKILITGVAGFIGYHLCKKLENKFSIIGIDNLNNYYDKELKMNRLKRLSSNNIFLEIDITNKKNLDDLFSKNNFDCVVHLAAQAGVRYSFEHPQSYIDSNIYGTFNILENLKSCKDTNLIFASTSSAYGLSKEHHPFSENADSNMPVSLYAATKKSCEVMIHNYSHNFKIPSTVLRFFTVYGPWGRPDMALFKFVKSMKNNEPINVYNDGNMWRDFTFIDDLVESISRLISIIPSENGRVDGDSLSKVAPYRIVNIGNQNTVKLNDFISALEDVIGIKAKRVNLPMQPGDVPFTLADSSLLTKLTNYKPSTEIKLGVKKFYDWYERYYIFKKHS
jgi:UDP-glucuronate 4-epimerase